MTTKRKATIEDLYEAEGKAELVNGEIVPMSPSGDWPTLAQFRISMSLFAYEQKTKLGRAYPDGIGYIVKLPNRESFSPAASFYIGERSAMRFLKGAPIFAVEIRSEGDYGQHAERHFANKRRDYFAAGTQVVWDVDVLGEVVVRSYRASDPQNPIIFHRGEIADAEPALPGWRMPVDELLPEE